MNKLTSNEKKYKKFVKKYKYIFKKLDIPKTHFDANGRMVGYCLAIINNISHNYALTIKKNSDQLCNLFNNLYKNPSLINTYANILLNIDTKININGCFEIFINNFLKMFNDLKNHHELFDILQIGLCYLLYNSIPCEINGDIEKNITNSKHYEHQLKIVMKNVEMFMKLKSYIINYFKNNVNDLISLIIGLSKRMYRN